MAPKAKAGANSLEVILVLPVTGEYRLLQKAFTEGCLQRKKLI